MEAKKPAAPPPATIIREGFTFEIKPKQGRWAERGGRLHQDPSRSAQVDE